MCHWLYYFLHHCICQCFDKIWLQFFVVVVLWCWSLLFLSYNCYLNIYFLIYFLMGEEDEDYRLNRVEDFKTKKKSHPKKSKTIPKRELNTWAFSIRLFSFTTLKCFVKWLLEFARRMKLHLIKGVHFWGCQRKQNWRRNVSCKGKHRCFVFLNQYHRSVLLFKSVFFLPYSEVCSLIEVLLNTRFGFQWFSVAILYRRKKKKKVHF